MSEVSPTALGSWGGGRFMHFGESLDDDRFCALLRPGNGVDTVITADVYGQGAADALVGRALSGLRRDDYALVGAIGHDFYTAERDGSRGFPRFTQVGLRGPDGYADYLRMAAERSLRRCGAEAFDVLLLHNPDRTGYSSPVVWEGMAALRDGGLTREVGLAPGPANGFTLDLIACLERFAAVIDWAMIILNPLEPWPGELVLAAAEAAGVRVITRVVDYGGLFWDDVLAGHRFAPGDHRNFRPAGWVQAGRERMDAMRPVAQRRGLGMLELAAAWNLAHPAVACAVPTLIQESGPRARPVEDKRAELARVATGLPLDADEVAAMRAAGDNTGSMTLKGASPNHHGEERPDRWSISPELAAVGARWGVDPERDLAQVRPAPLAGDAPALPMR